MGTSSSMATGSHDCCRSLLWTMPLVLAVHSMEEYVSCDRFTYFFMGDRYPEFQDKAVLLRGVALLTGATTLVVIAGARDRTGRWTQVSQVGGVALCLNGTQHILLSLRHRTLVPGTVTAALLILPFSIALGRCISRQRGTAVRSVLGWLCAGAAMLVCATYFSLQIAYRITRAERSIRADRSMLETGG